MFEPLFFVLRNTLTTLIIQNKCISWKSFIKVKFSRKKLHSVYPYYIYKNRN